METMEAPRLGCGLLTAALAASLVLSFMFEGLWMVALLFAYLPVLAVVTAAALPLHALARRLGVANWATAGFTGLCAGLISTGLAGALLAVYAAGPGFIVTLVLKNLFGRARPRSGGRTARPVRTSR